LDKSPILQESERPVASNPVTCEAARGFFTSGNLVPDRTESDDEFVD